MRSVSEFGLRTAIISIGAFGLIATAGFLGLRVHRGIGDFQLTHYYFNYESEFLRRGLIGEVLRVIGFPISNLTVSLLYSAAVLVFLLLLIFATLKALGHSRPRAGLLFLLFMLACPGLTLHYAYSSYGYLDIFQLLLAACGLFVILRAPMAVSLFVAILFSVFAILIHEAGLMTIAPVLIAALALRFDSLTFRHLVLIFASLLAVTMIIWRLGGADTLSFDEHMAALSATDGNISPDAVVILHRSLADNVGLIIPRSPWWYIWQQIKFLVLALPYLYFFALTLHMTLHHFKSRNRWLGPAAMGFAIVSPILLYPVGHDYFRWWAAVMANYFMLTLFLCNLSSEYREKYQTLVEKHEAIVLIGILIGVMLGGIGGMESFSVHTAPASMFYRMIF